MQIDAILCNHAEAVNNLLYIAGGGIDVVFVPPGINPPYPCNLGIGIMATVPWDQTNKQHQIDIRLVSEDGQPVEVPVGNDSRQPLQARLAFNVGRPAGIGVGDEQHVCLAANLPALPIPAFGKYEFIITVDGDDDKTDRHLAFRVMPNVGMQMMVGPMGPSTLPRF